MNRSAALLAVVLLGGLSALTACGGDDGPDVKVADVVRADVREVVDAPATVTARASSTVTSPAAGTVGALLVQDGQAVTKGQVLLRITSPQAQQALARAQQAARAAADRVDLPRADLGPLQDQLDAAAATAFRSAREAAALVPDAAARARVLADVAAAQARYDATAAAARSVAGSVGAGVESVEEALNAVGGSQRLQSDALLSVARSTVDALVVRAPQAGVVSLGGGDAAPSTDVSSLLDQLPPSLASQAGALAGSSSTSSTRTTVAVGAPVTQGQQLLAVTDVRGLGLTAEVDETDVLLVRKGIPADVELDAVPGQAFTAKVLAVDVTPSAGARGGVAYRVRLSLLAEPGDPTPLPGMSAVASLRVRESSQVVAVPSAAVVRVGTADAVFVLVDGTYRRREVSLGARGEDVVEVRSGVVVGDRVVVTDADQLRDGQDA